MSSAEREEALSGALERSVARDDVLTAAEAAETAVRLVCEGQRWDEPPSRQKTLFRSALERHCAEAQEVGGSESAAARSLHWEHAANIVRFCRVLRVKLDGDESEGDEEDASAMYESALGVLTSEIEDPALRVRMTLGFVRSKRQDGEFVETKTEEWFFGSGADPLRAEFDLNQAAGLVQKKQAYEITGSLKESNWETGPQALWASGNRYAVARAWGAIADDDGPAVERWLAMAEKKIRAEFRPDEPPPPRLLFQLLTIKLTDAEFNAVEPRNPEAVRHAVACVSEALDIVDSVRGRWRVVMRSRSPLSLAFQRIHGDIALILAELADDDEACELGLCVALSAKQTGFAILMRSNGTLLREKVGESVKRIDDCDAEYENARDQANLPRDYCRKLLADADRLTRKFRDDFPSLLADLVLPEQPRIDEILELVAGRHVLDYVALESCLTPRQATWFRTVVGRDGSIRFGVVDAGPALRKFTEAETPHELGKIVCELNSSDWQELGANLLPSSLRTELSEMAAGDHRDILVSSHARLTAFPWGALAFDASGTRLVERAVLSQTPVLTCLTHRSVEPASGPALVRLVRKVPGETAIDIRGEQDAWGSREETTLLRLSRRGAASTASHRWRSTVRSRTLWPTPSTPTDSSISRLTATRRAASIKPCSYPSRSQPFRRCGFAGQRP